MAGNETHDRWSLADPDIEEKIARWRARPPPLPLVDPVQRVAAMDPPRLIPWLAPPDVPEQNKRAALEQRVVDQARRGRVADTPLNYRIAGPAEQGFGYNQQWGGLMLEAPLLESKWLDREKTVGWNRFDNPFYDKKTRPSPDSRMGNMDAFIHTHPNWTQSGGRVPGPEDFGRPHPVYGIHRDRIWVLYPRERQEKQLWP